VLNHRCAADYSEEVWGVEVDGRDRRREVGEKRVMRVWTGYEFPARRGKYSGFMLTKEHFNGIDWDDTGKKRGIFMFVGEDGKGWAEDVDKEMGNFDYL
jgi:alpha-amylase